MAINLNQQNPVNPQGQPQDQQNQQAAGQFKPRTSGFTNIQRVLGANKNNQLGQTIGQGVQNITNKTQGQTQKAQQDFTKDIGQSVQDIKQGTKVQENLSGLDFTKNSEEAANKIQEVGGDEYTNATANLRRGYAGPQGLQNEGQLQSQAQQLGQTAQGLMTQGGRQAALQRFVNAGPGYTQGKQQLDNLLLGQNQQAITQARRAAAQTAASTQEQIQKAQQEALSTGQQFNTLGQDITGKVQGLGQNLGSALDTRTQTKIAEAQTQVKGLQDRLNKGEITQEDYDLMSNQILGSSDIYNLSNQNLASMIGANTDYNRSNVAQQQEINARDALAKLSGAKTGDELVDLNESLAGTAGGAIIKNQQGLDVLAQQKAAAQEAMKNFAFNFDTNKFMPGSNYRPDALKYEDVSKIGPDYKYNPMDEALKQQNNQLLQAGVWQNTQLAPTGKSGDIMAETAQQQRNIALDYIRSHGGQQVTQEQMAAANTELNKDIYNQQLQNAVSQYGATNRQYGIGNNLSRLLKDNKTFGVK